MATVAATVAPQPRPPAGLRRALRRSGRREQWRAALLVLPLFLFLLASFIVPIGAMLARGVVDTDVARILPRVSAELRRWDGRELPPDAAYAAMVDDLRAAREAGTLASAATRLNYDVAGFRTLLVTSGRASPGEPPTSPRQALLDVDPKWGERETWAAIRRAGGPVTDFYLLAALDLRRDADNAIAAAPANEAVFRNVLGRTLWIAGMVTLDVPGARLSGRAVHRAPAAAARCAAAVPRAAAVLDVAAGAHGCVGRAAAARGHPQQPAAFARHRPRAVADDLQPLRRLRRDGARAAAVHGAAALRGDEGRSRRRTSAPRRRSGAPPFTAFRRVYLPQTLPGIAAGCLMVFIQALGYYITPALVGGADDQMISYFIAFYASQHGQLGNGGGAVDHAARRPRSRCMPCTTG